MNAKKQIDLFEKIIKKYSKRKVKNVLDIACGTSLQGREMAKRGYKVTGLDLSRQMLTYLKSENPKINTKKADMRNFKLKTKTDFAFIMMGSFRFKNNNDLLKHLNSVSKSLKKGGLYLIENMELDWKNLSYKPIKWVMKRDSISVKTTYMIKPKDMLSQISEEILTLEVNDRGKKMKFIERSDIKHVFPQEFLSLIKLNGKFEFLGWFERFKFKKLKKASLKLLWLIS